MAVWGWRIEGKDMHVLDEMDEGLVTGMHDRFVRALGPSADDEADWDPTDAP